MGNAIGAILAFLVARFFLRDFVVRKIITRYPKIKEFEESFFSHGFSTVLFLRLVPLFPFNGLNYALGVTKVSLKDYVWGTFLGIIPGTILFVYFGDSFAQFSYGHIALSVVGIIGLSYGGKKWAARYKNK